jgi:hypothetical protein
MKSIPTAFTYIPDQSRLHKKEVSKTVPKRAVSLFSDDDDVITVPPSSSSKQASEDVRQEAKRSEPSRSQQAQVSTTVEEVHEKSIPSAAVNDSNFGDSTIDFIAPKPSQSAEQELEKAMRRNSQTQARGFVSSSQSTLFAPTTAKSTLFERTDHVDNLEKKVDDLFIPKSDEKVVACQSF